MTKEEAFFLETQYREGKPLVTLWRFLYTDRIRLLVATVFFAIKSSPTWILPIFVAKVIDLLHVPTEHTLHDIAIYAAIMAVMYLQNSPMHMVFTRLFSRTCRNVEARLRGSIIRRLQQLSISFHGETQSGRLQAKVLRDVEAVQRLMAQIFHAYVPAIITISVTTVISLQKQPKMILFFALVVPVGAVFRAAFISRLRKRNREYRRQIEAMSGKVSEMIAMIPVARAHAVEDEEVRRMDEELNQVRDTGYRLDMINEFFGSSNWVTFNLFRLGCLVFSSVMAYHGRISVGDVIMYQGFFELVLGLVTQVLASYPMITAGFESINSIGEVLRSPDIEHNAGKAKLKTVQGHFCFEHVTFQYRSAAEPSIVDLSLEVKPGESIAVVGPSGAGKSTLMNLLVGFYRPTSGRILLDGRDTSEIDMRTFRRHLAVVPQNTVLFSGSIRDNIAYGMPDVSDAQIRQAIEMASAAEFIDEQPRGLETMIGENGVKLSGGQRQRLAIARAMIRSPRVIIFDEATSSLDVLSEQLVQQAIERLLQGRTTFVVAHRLSTIRKCTRIVVMKDGKCVEMGSHEELMNRQGEFYRLKSLQV